MWQETVNSQRQEQKEGPTPKDSHFFLTLELRSQEPPRKCLKKSLYRFPRPCGFPIGTIRNHLKQSQGTMWVLLPKQAGTVMKLPSFWTTTARPAGQRLGNVLFHPGANWKLGPQRGTEKENKHFHSWHHEWVYQSTLTSTELNKRPFFIWTTIGSKLAWPCEQVGH